MKRSAPTPHEVRFGRDALPVRRPGRRRPDAWFWAIAISALAAIGIALVSQHGFGMEPCPWCVLQRLIFIAIAVAALIGLVWRRAIGRAVAAALVLLLAIAGIASAAWQHFYAAPSGSCNLTLADKIINGLGLDALIPDLFAPRATCADAAVSLLGVSYDLWSLALFALLGLAALVVLLRQRAR